MLPERKAIKLALIKLLEEKGPLASGKVYSRLREQFRLTNQDLAKTTNDGENYFEKEVRWAKKDLVDDGTIKGPPESGRGIWELKVVQRTTEDLAPVLCDTPVELESQLSRISPSELRPEGQIAPRKISTLAETFSRDARVVAFVLGEATGICEACSNPSPFRKDNGDPFLEVHHLKRLADGGRDKVENTIAVCPNCHRELHYGKNREALKALVYSRIERLVKE